MLLTRSRSRISARGIRWAAVLALIMVLMSVVTAGPASAAVVRPFEKVFSTQTNGAIAITGNTLLTCDTANTNCVNALSGANQTQGNNQFTMRVLDADDDPTTSMSSGATVRIPPGSTVLYAGLFWGAAVTAGAGGTAATGAIGTTIKLRPPGAAAYQTITASTTDRLTTGNRDYSSYADITSIVQAGGAGMYWGADISAATGSDRYGGWSIVVAYSNPNLPLRDLNVFSGYASVQTNQVIGTSISGFLTPLTGPVNASFGSVTYEGDQQLAGDYLQVGSTRIADATSPSSNFFNGRVSEAGVALTDRTPANLNNMAVDAKVVNVPDLLANGQTDTSVTFGTTGDFYYPAALTTQIDLYAPTIQGEKSVVNVNGNAVARVGDVLEYTSTFSNLSIDPPSVSS